MEEVPTECWGWEMVDLAVYVAQLRVRFEVEHQTGTIADVCAVEQTLWLAWSRMVLGDGEELPWGAIPSVENGARICQSGSSSARRL